MTVLYWDAQRGIIVNSNSNSSSNSKQPEGKQIIQEIRDLRRRHPSKEEKEEKDARTLIVRKPMTTEIKNTPAIKREFNKHHPHLVIRGARTTPAGSIVIELDDPEEAKRVKENWKADSFGGNSGVVHLTFGNFGKFETRSQLSSSGSVRLLVTAQSKILLLLAVT